MLKGKDVLVIGAREGGYGASIARAFVRAGATVWATTLTPEDLKERAFFDGLGARLVEVPLKFEAGAREKVAADLATIEAWLKERGVERLTAVVHAVAGGFARQPAVMKAVGDILKGKQQFSDLATLVKREVYYVNAGSFPDTVNGLAGLIDGETHLVALTYRGSLPYFIAETKRYLEDLGLRMARNGRRTLLAALPEAWTQSSQFFTGIEVAVMYNYVEALHGATDVSEETAPAFALMREAVGRLEGFDRVLDELRVFFAERWREITPSADQAQVYAIVQELYGRMRNDGTFPIMRRAVEAVSDFVREASATILVRDLIEAGAYEPGDIRQVHYANLTRKATISAMPRLEPRVRVPGPIRRWVTYEKDEVRRTLNMYGKNFLFLDRVIMETGEVRDGGMGFGSFTVPGPDENPIMKDHFVGMPLFGGHLQMEAVAQFGTFMLLKCLSDQKAVPILTGTEFPDLNTMAPPGEKLSMMGIIRLHEKRLLTLEAFIENRYARSKGIIRGMILSERLVRKMVSSF
ncbi:MAG: hypothetical protein LDL33_01450 [Desulfomonile sp.]|nr:hypothetical protein [Desulfomonile sp.]